MRSPSRLIVLLGCLVSCAWTAAGCASSEPGASTATDAQYLAAVDLAAPGISTYRTDSELIRMGHAACDGFGSGVSYEELADRLSLDEGANPLPSEDLGAVITSAVTAYCPKFLSEVS
jgi:hypothetical protein